MHELVELERLGDEIRGALLACVQGILEVPVTRDHDRHDGGIPADGGIDDLSSVDARQPEVGDEDVEGELVEQLQRFFACFSLHDLEIPFPEPFRRHRSQGRFVVDEEEVGGGLRPCGAPTS